MMKRWCRGFRWGTPPVRISQQSPRRLLWLQFCLWFVMSHGSCRSSALFFLGLTGPSSVLGSFFIFLRLRISETPLLWLAIQYRWFLVRWSVPEFGSIVFKRKVSLLLLTHKLFSIVWVYFSQSLFALVCVCLCFNCLCFFLSFSICGHLSLETIV